MEFTGAARYGDWIEDLFYNGIRAALSTGSDGSTYYYADYHTEMASKVYYFGKWPCCFGDLYSGRADYHNLIYFRNESDLFVNLSPSVHAPLLARGTN
jgi:DUF1680 family protein